MNRECSSFADSGCVIRTDSKASESLAEARGTAASEGELKLGFSQGGSRFGSCELRNL